VSFVRIMVVDDFEPWRRVLSETIETRPGWRVVGEAADGLQAIRRSLELQPDVIVLDIGLPRLNGIEAAREIRKLLPQSRILFLSADYSLEIAGEALKTGVGGYVVKSDAGRQLLEGMEAVINGHRFLSDRLARLILDKEEVPNVFKQDR